MLGLKVGASEAEPFWTEFRRSLNRRGLRGVKLVISEPRGHQGHRILGARRHLAALPSALHEERLGTRRQGAGKTQARRSGAGSRLPSEPSSFQTRPTRRARGGDPQPISSEASFQNSERSWTRPRRRARAHELPTDALDPDRQHQPARTAERGDQAAHERRGHLPAASITRLAGAVMLFPTRLPSVAHRVPRISACPGCGLTSGAGTRPSTSSRSTLHEKTAPQGRFIKPADGGSNRLAAPSKHPNDT